MFNALLGALALAAAQPDAAVLLTAADAPRAAFLNSVVEVRATAREKDKPDRHAEFELYVGGEDRLLVVFTDEKNQGRKFIANGGKTWLIAPNSSRPVAVTAKQRLVGGASFADVARVRLSRDYTGELRPQPEPCGEPERPCRVLDISAVAKTAPYAAGVLWIDARGLVRKAVYALASGKPARELSFEYREKAGRTVLSKAVIVDLLSGEQALATTLEYLNYRQVPMPDELFDPERALEPPGSDR
ncbi:MAG: outer membrane lipoprotein-sorting protein [Gammaproteobacteria bacterium]|nr:outer membrane lipoprotein-sorting protein [Gammaproteobacteria bacterium]